MEGPAAVLLDDLGGHQKACARHVAVGTQQGAGEVEEPGLPQKPDGISGGDPVVPEVFGVAVAGHRVIALIEGAVHLPHKVGVHQIVRVKDKIAVIAVLTLLLQLAEEVVHGVALALVNGVPPLVHEGSRLPGGPGGVVGAVVRHHVQVQQLLGIVLFSETVQQLADHLFLIAGGDHHRKAVEPAGLMAVLMPAQQQAHHQIKALVQIQQGKQQHNAPVQPFDKFQNRHCIVFLRYTVKAKRTVKKVGPFFRGAYHTIFLKYYKSVTHQLTEH